MKTIFSAIAVIDWIVHGAVGEKFFGSLGCAPSNMCMDLNDLAISLIGLYIGFELLIAPKSAALYGLHRLVLPGDTSTFLGRIAK